MNITVMNIESLIVPYVLSGCSEYSPCVGIKLFAAIIGVVIGFASFISIIFSKTIRASSGLPKKLAVLVIFFTVYLFIVAFFFFAEIDGTSYKGQLTLQSNESFVGMLLFSTFIHGLLFSLTGILVKMIIIIARDFLIIISKE